MDLPSDAIIIGITTLNAYQPGWISVGIKADLTQSNLNIVAINHYSSSTLSDVIYITVCYV